MIKEENGNYCVFAVMLRTQIYELFEDDGDAQKEADHRNELYPRGHRYKAVPIIVKRSTAEPRNRKIQGNTITHKANGSGRLRCMPHRIVKDTYEVDEKVNCKRCLITSS